MDSNNYFVSRGAAIAKGTRGKKERSEVCNKLSVNKLFWLLGKVSRNASRGGTSHPSGHAAVRPVELLAHGPDCTLFQCAGIKGLLVKCTKTLTGLERYGDALLHSRIYRYYGYGVIAHDYLTVGVSILYAEKS